MDERETYGYLITIDTSDGVGATSVYGSYEIKSILEEGAKIRGYKAGVSELDTPLKPTDDYKFRGVVNIEKAV